MWRTMIITSCSSGVEQKRSEGRVYGPGSAARVSDRQLEPSKAQAADERQANNR